MVGDLGNFVGRDLGSQFMSKPQKLAEGDSVAEEIAFETVSFTDDITGKTKTFQFNPETHHPPDSSGRMRKKGVSSSDVATTGGTTFFDTAELVEEAAAPAGPAAAPRQERPPIPINPETDADEAERQADRDQMFNPITAIGKRISPAEIHARNQMHQFAGKAISNKFNIPFDPEDELLQAMTTGITPQVRNKSDLIINANDPSIRFSEAPSLIRDNRKEGWGLSDEMARSELDYALGKTGYKDATLVTDEDVGGTSVERTEISPKDLTKTGIEDMEEASDMSLADLESGLTATEIRIAADPHRRGKGPNPQEAATIERERKDVGILPPTSDRRSTAKPYEMFKEGRPNFFEAPRAFPDRSGERVNSPYTAAEEAHAKATGLSDEAARNDLLIKQIPLLKRFRTDGGDSGDPVVKANEGKKGIASLVPPEVAKPLVAEDLITKGYTGDAKDKDVTVKGLLDPDSQKLMDALDKEEEERKEEERLELAKNSPEAWAKKFEQANAARLQRLAALNVSPESGTGGGEGGGGGGTRGVGVGSGTGYGGVKPTELFSTEDTGFSASDIWTPDSARDAYSEYLSGLYDTEEISDDSEAYFGEADFDDYDTMIKEGGSVPFAQGGLVRLAKGGLEDLERGRVKAEAETDERAKLIDQHKKDYFFFKRKHPKSDYYDTKSTETLREHAERFKELHSILEEKKKAYLERREQDRKDSLIKGDEEKGINERSKHPTPGKWNDIIDQNVKSGGPVRYANGGGLSSMQPPIDSGDFVIASDVVSGIGDGSSDFGVQRLTEELGVPPRPFSAALGGEVRGPGSGLDDLIQTSVRGKQAARLANQEFVVPRQDVMKIGKGSLKNGQEMLYALMDRVRKQKTGGQQPPRLQGSLAALMGNMRS